MQNMTIKKLIPKYLNHLKAIGRADRTIHNTKYDLRDFSRFLDDMSVFGLDDLSPEVMSEYQADLAFRLTHKGKPMAVRSQIQLLGVAKGFTRFLKQKDYLFDDPGAKIKLPKKPKRLPKVILSEDDVIQTLKAPDTHTNQGYRNRIIIEVLYDTAIRRAELSDLKINQIDLETGYVHIRSGKGDKDRVVPLSKRVCGLVRNYILLVRPAFAKRSKDPDEGYLILNRWGKKMAGEGIRAVVKRCCSLAAVEKSVSPHIYRHSCATHMLKNGAPVRHLQEMLGHESLESTQIYTRVTINDLKEVHAKYHPSESIESQ